MNEGQHEHRHENHPENANGVLHRVRDSIATITSGTADGFGAMVVGQPSENARDARRVGDRRSPREVESEEKAGLCEAMAFETRLAPLTEKQKAALDLLTMGKTIVATAKSLKIDPSTIHRWKATSPLFIAELNRRQAALYDNIVVKLRLTMQSAVDQLHAVMNGNYKSDRIDAMWKLLPMLKPQRLIAPAAPTTALGVLDELVRMERAKRGEVVEMEITHEERFAHVFPEDRLTEADPLDVDVPQKMGSGEFNLLHQEHNELHIPQNDVDNIAQCAEHHI